MLKKTMTAVTFTLFSTISTAAISSSISATALTITEAEQKIADKAYRKGLDYRITGVHYGNYVYMIATTIPKQE